MAANQFMDLMEINLQDAEEDFGLLLMGNTCSGKSALGNSILGQDVFVSRGGWQSVTRQHHVGVTIINGRTVKIVDTPGLNDTELKTRRDRLDLVIDEMTRSLVQFPNGFHSVLLVIPYTKRVDEQERQTIETIVGLLDAAAVARHGILALSHGDAFKRDFPQSIGVERWMETLPLRYQWVNDICNERCILFDNVTLDEYEKEQQRDDLVNMVDSLDNTTRYKPNICNLPIDSRNTAVSNREKIVKYVKALRILGLFRYKLRAIIDVFTQLAENKLKEEARTIVDLLRADQVFGASDLRTFLNRVEALDHRSEHQQNVANDIHETVIKLQLKIDTKIESTLYWQDLRRRVAQFFNNLFSYCEIL